MIFDELPDKISDMDLDQMLEIGGITENDYAVDYAKFDNEELKEKVSIRLNTEIATAADYIMRKHNISSNYFYKIATKHGAMLMAKNKHFSRLIELTDLVHKIYDKAQDTGDVQLITATYELLKDIDVHDINLGGHQKSIYPLPKWRLYLDSLAYRMYLPKSCVYVSAIVLSMSTCVKLVTYNYLMTQLETTLTKRLSAVRKFLQIVSTHKDYAVIKEIVANSHFADILP